MHCKNWQDLVAEAVNWKDLKAALRAWNDGFEWVKVHDLDPSLRTFKLLKFFYDDLTFHFDRWRCSATIDELLSYALANSGIATTILRFLLHACSVLFYELTQEAFDMLSEFCEKLAPRFFDQTLFKAYVLALMTLAVRLPDASEKLTKLRKLNTGMQLAETVILRASMFQGLPPECFQLVDTGLALQVYVDVERLDRRIRLWNVLELATGLINWFFEQAPSSHCVGYVEKSLCLICQALKKCDASDSRNIECRVFCRLADVFDLGDHVISEETSSLAQSLFIELLKLLSFSGVIDVFTQIIPQKDTSAEFCLLLTLMRQFVSMKWPDKAHDVDPASFKKLRDIFGWLFTSGALRFNPTDTEEEDMKQARGFLEQVETVEVGLNFYLTVIWHEVKGGTDYSGFLSSGKQVSESWLETLLEQQVEITEPRHENYLFVARSTIEYALDVNDEPSLVVEEGLPPC